MKSIPATLLSAAVAAAPFFAASLQAATLTLDKVQQRYPWNGIVDIDYTITLGANETLAPGDDAVEITVTDNSVSPAKTYVPYALSKVPLPIEAGQHRFTWDAKADGVVFKSETVKVEAKLRHYPAVYMVIDVSGGSTADCFPVDYYDGEPAGGFNQDVYKGDKIVLRRIRPGSYMAGANSGDQGYKSDRMRAKHRVTLTKPFYIGIFEMTQKQYKNVTGKSGAAGFAGDFRPANGISYNALRGSGWPQSAPVASGSVMAIFDAKCKSKDANGNYTVAVTGFDLPTEFQWEFACRAGTMTATYTGVEVTTASAFKTEVMKIARCSSTQGDGKGGYSNAPTVVGCYQPNDYGLYDMNGNLWEWCRDWFKWYPEELNQVIDPAGSTSGENGSRRTCRGGYYADGDEFQCSASRTSVHPDNTAQWYTFRLANLIP